MLLRLANGVLRRLGYLLLPIESPGYSTECVTLQSSGEAKGRVLLAYVLAPFLADDDGPDSSHTHHLESTLIAQAWRDAGYTVDVIDYMHAEFQPTEHYDFFVSARTFLSRIKPRLNPECRTIAHMDTSHYVANNAAAWRRAEAVQHRRGVDLRDSIRLIEDNDGLEAADLVVVLGNEVTAATYQYANKPTYLLDVPSALPERPQPAKDAALAAMHFIWLGSNGILHKGLDLVLEAFAGLPDFQLTVCGPVDHEAAFRDAYKKELAAPNIKCQGWVDVASDEFQSLCDTAIGLVYPSCREGQAGAVVNCIKAGLLPLISRESGVSVDGFGEYLDDSVESIRETVKRIATMNAEALYDRLDKSWQHGIDHHTPAAYLERYASIINSIEHQQEDVQ